MQLLTRRKELSFNKGKKKGRKTTQQAGNQLLGWQTFGQDKT